MWSFRCCHFKIGMASTSAFYKRKHFGFPISGFFVEQGELEKEPMPLPATKLT